MQTICKVNTAVNVDNTSKLGLSNSNNIENENQRLNFPSSIVCEVNSNETLCVEGALTASTLEASQQLASEGNEIPSLILKMSNTHTLPEIDERSQFNQVATICIVSEIRSNLDANLTYVSSTDDASNTQNFSGSANETSKYSETKTFSHVLKFHETTWKQQVSNRIVETLASGKQELELVIAPKSLGKIAIYVSSSGDILNLTIAADNLNTASLLSAALPEIENNLKDSGIGVLSTKLGSNGAHAEQEQNNEKSEAEPSKRFQGQSTESEDDEGAQKIGAVNYHTGKYSYEV